jgi:hypothetical protein
MEFTGDLGIFLGFPGNFVSYRQFPGNPGNPNNFPQPSPGKNCKLPKLNKKTKKFHWKISKDSPPCFEKSIGFGIESGHLYQIGSAKTNQVQREFIGLFHFFLPDFSQ